MPYPILAAILMQMRHDDLLRAAQRARLVRESRVNETSSFSVRRWLARRLSPIKARWSLGPVRGLST